MQKIFTTPDIGQVNTLQTQLQKKGIRVVVNGHKDWYSVWVYRAIDASVAKVIIANLEIGAIKKQVQSTPKVWTCLTSAKPNLRIKNESVVEKAKKPAWEHNKNSNTGFSFPDTLLKIRRFECALQRQKLFDSLAPGVMRHFVKSPVKSKLRFTRFKTKRSSYFHNTAQFPRLIAPPAKHVSVLQSIQQQIRYSRFLKAINDKHRY